MKSLMPFYGETRKITSAGLSGEVLPHGKDNPNRSVAQAVGD